MGGGGGSAEVWAFPLQQLHQSLVFMTCLQKNSLITDENGNLMLINRSNINSSLLDNIKGLQKEVEMLLNGSTKSHYCFLIKVGKFIIANGPLVMTQEVGKVYLKEKGTGQ